MGGLVDAALDPSGPAALDLVGHGVRQGGDRPGGRDDVAVAVEHPVELGQRQRTVPAQDRDAGDPQVSAAHGLRPFAGRRQGAAVDVRGTAALRPRHRWVEELAQVGEGVDEVPSLLRDVDEPVVELLQAVDERISFGLELDPPPEAEARSASEVVGAAATERVDRVGGGPLLWRGKVGVRDGWRHGHPPWSRRRRGGAATECGHCRRSAPRVFRGGVTPLSPVPRARTSVSIRRRFDTDVR
jgi:hypothetical protein